MKDEQELTVSIKRSNNGGGDGDDNNDGDGGDIDGDDDNGHGGHLLTAYMHRSSASQTAATFNPSNNSMSSMPSFRKRNESIKRLRISPEVSSETQVQAAWLYTSNPLFPTV